MQKIKPKAKHKKRKNQKNIDLHECIFKCSFALVTPLGGIVCRKIGDYVDDYNYDCPKK